MEEKEEEYTLSTTEIVKRLRQFDYKDEDFGERSFDVKRDIQSLIHLFALIDNVIVNTSPEMWEMVDNTRDTLIDYIQKYNLKQE